jgi:hypothetical protein
MAPAFLMTFVNAVRFAKFCCEQSLYEGPKRDRPWPIRELEGETIACEERFLTVHDCRGAALPGVSAAEQHLRISYKVCL